MGDAPYRRVVRDTEVGDAPYRRVARDTEVGDGRCPLQTCSEVGAQRWDTEVGDAPYRV